MHPPRSADLLPRYLEARRRLEARRTARVRRRTRKMLPWLVGGWLVLNIPPGILFLIVVTGTTGTVAESLRYALAIILWAMISGGGVLVLGWAALISLEIGGRRATLRRKRWLRPGADD